MRKSLRLIALAVAHARRGACRRRDSGRPAVGGWGSPLPDGQAGSDLARQASARTTFHGHVGSGALVLGQKSIAAPMSVWLDIADREQVLVIAPDGVKGSDGQTGWNDCRADAETSPHSDDTGFVNAIIDKAIAEDDADPSRVYVMGVSNGAGMVLRLASEIGRGWLDSPPQRFRWRRRALARRRQSRCPRFSSPAPATRWRLTTGAKCRCSLARSGLGDRRRSVGGNLAQARPASRHRCRQSRAASLQRRPDPGHPFRVGERSAQAASETAQNRHHGGHAEPSISKRTGWLLTKFLGPQNGDVELAEEVWEFFKGKRSGLRAVTMKRAALCGPFAPCTTTAAPAYLVGTICMRISPPG